LISSHLTSNLSCEVQSFFLGEDCIETVKDLNKKPDIIIQDYELPFQNGIEVMLSVKKKYPDIVFIFLSGQTNVKVAVNALQQGAYDYIVKDTFAKENALNKIDQIIRFKKLEKTSESRKLSTFLLTGLLVISWIFLLIYYFFLR